MAKRRDQDALDARRYRAIREFASLEVEVLDDGKYRITAERLVGETLDQYADQIIADMEKELTCKKD